MEMQFADQCLSNEWAIACGHDLIIWKNNKLHSIKDSDLQGVHGIRQVRENEVEILTDPWRDDSAIWLFDVMSENRIKIRDFQDCKLKEYTEDIKWQHHNIDHNLDFFRTFKIWTTEDFWRSDLINDLVSLVSKELGSPFMMY